MVTGGNARLAWEILVIFAEWGGILGLNCVVVGDWRIRHMWGLRGFGSSMSCDNLDRLHLLQVKLITVDRHAGLPCAHVIMAFCNRGLV